MENVVLLILDSLRGDHIEKHAPIITDLADNNLFFEQAVAPSRWSLPSHASLFTGLAPHEHGIHTMDDEFDGLPLVERMNEKGCSTFGVSANPFCSAAFGFEEPFDDFRYTLDNRLPRGVDVSSVVGTPSESGKRGGPLRRYSSLIRAVFGHEEILASLYNVGFSTLRKAVGEFESLQHIPHPLFQASTVYLYDPERNTRAIEQYLDERTDGEPFFVFSNYMDTHRPYYPSESYQRQKLGAKLSFREMKRLNEGVGHPQSFAAQQAHGLIDESDLAVVRNLYAGTVSEVDAHIRRILQTLEENGLREETLVVVTADHGEALGEIGPRGHRRVGHIDTVSDHVLTVPLLFINPSLEPIQIEEPVPLTCLYDVLAEGPPTAAPGIVDRLVTEGPVVSECLATKNTWDEEDREDVTKDFERRQTAEHTCVMFEGQQKIAFDTAGDLWAWEGEEPTEVEDLNPGLEETCRSRLDRIEETLWRGGRDVSTGKDHDVRSQLEELGYL